MFYLESHFRGLNSSVSRLYFLNVWYQFIDGKQFFLETYNSLSCNICEKVMRPVAFIFEHFLF